MPGYQKVGAKVAIEAVFSHTAMPLNPSHNRLTNELEQPQVSAFVAAQKLLGKDLKTVDELIHAQLKSRLPLINELGLHIVKSGGKRLRPMFVLLLSQALGYTGKKHHLIAAIVELIHTASLLHDDVIDNADLRRSQLTAKKIWGNNASVLVGDFLYSRAFQLIVQADSLEIASVLANTTNLIAEGEVHQLIYKNKLNLDEEIFLDIIRCKTAILFEASAHISAQLANTDTKCRQAMCQLGSSLGIGFQLIDDVLDYADAENTGKAIGNDLNEGKTTLPLIYAIKHASAEQRKHLEKSLTTGNHSPQQIQYLVEMVRRSGGLQYTHARASEYFSQTQDLLQTHLPVSPYKKALLQLVSFLQNRNL